jgi:hypothetical protein
VKVFILIKGANNQGRSFNEKETEISISQADNLVKSVPNTPLDIQKLMQEEP